MSFKDYLWTSHTLLLLLAKFLKPFWVRLKVHFTYKNSLESKKKCYKNLILLLITSEVELFEVVKKPHPTLPTMSNNLT